MHTIVGAFLLALLSSALSQKILLPPNVQVEGVAHAAGSLFFAGDFRRGAVLLVDFATGFTTTVVPPAPDRLATGLTARNGTLFVAGGGTLGVLTSPPRMFAYDVLSGDTIAACDAPPGAIVNDVAADDRFAYYTDSLLGNVYALRVASLPRCDVSVIELPRALFAGGRPPLRANGIVRFASGLVVANTALGSLFFVDLETNATQRVLPDNAVAGAGGLDIYEQERGRAAVLLVTQSPLRLISVWRLWAAGDGVKARFVQNITSEEFVTPSNVALGGGRLVVGDPQSSSFPLTADLPDGTQLAVLGFEIRAAHGSK